MNVPMVLINPKNRPHPILSTYAFDLRLVSSDIHDIPPFTILISLILRGPLKITANSKDSNQSHYNTLQGFIVIKVNAYRIIKISTIYLN
ncbi:hypothetical protein GCM10025860_02010 [Methanobacterium ferruginis]|nr:hypothetical protein GCM10025860_02010 [Methanobacterium ferruginis]